MIKTRDQFEKLIPHAGTMLMIDGVTAWDEEKICCRSRCHQAPDNPLRKDGRLSAHHGIEFAAQAAAIHGGLLSDGERVPLRALAAVRQAQFARPWLDDLDGDLEITSSLLMLDQMAAIYQASLTHDGDDVATMRLTLMTIEPGFETS